MSFIICLLLVFLPVSAQSNLRDYKMAGPYKVVARDGQFRASKGGSERDMWTAYECAKLGYSDKALEIINAYASTLERFDGHDAPLCAIQGFHLVRAMTLLRSHATDEWSTMIRRAMIPTIIKFEADCPYANGNWGAIVNRLRMACAIFLEDSVMYKAAVDYFLYANDNGALPHYISESGQCQETGRDQGHAQLGLGMMCDICEMAWEHGDDLWGALDNRLMKGVEYTARYNLGYDVPFSTWTDCTGLYNDWTEPGSMGRGRIWDIYQKPFDHYTKVKHQQMPYTKRLLGLQSKAIRRGEMKENTEGRTFQLPEVKEEKRLHQVFTYPAPQGAPLKADYDVFVQPRGASEWTKVDTYMAKVNASVGNSRHKISEISYCLFDFSGNVFVKVISKKRKFRTARIRPDYRGTIANVLNDSTVQFLLFQPENVSVELDGDITNNLLVFTSKPPVSKEEAEQEAKAQGRKFIYIPPGFYKPDTSTIIGWLDKIENESVIYLAGGVYIDGTLPIEDTHDVSILGRGIARPGRGYEGAHVYRSHNVLIDGLVLNTCPIGESHHVTLHDVRSISHPSWGDGLNVFGGCSDILFDRVFCRNSDDCTTAYATRKGFSGSTRNVTMLNSTLWADVAHPIFIGIHGNAERGDTIEHLRYENIDILGQAEPQVDYQGCLAINSGDNNLVRDVVFDNIRIEQIEQGSIAQVKVGYNQKYCAAPGRGVEDVTFRNIRYYGELPTSLCIINGYNDERQVRNITFEGLKINGQIMHEKMQGKPSWYSTADYIPMYVGNHVRNIVFTKDNRSTLASQSLAYCSSQVDRALEAMQPIDYTMMPRNILNDQHTWNLRKESLQEWCSGFWTGILWMTYGYNKSEFVGKAAEAYTNAIIPAITKSGFDHDLGFITINTLLKGYEQTKNKQYKEIALRAADSLATLFNPNVGTILSWPGRIKYYGGHNTIVDNMMNLELLLWASLAENSSSKNDGNEGKRKKLYDIALRHAETTMKNHFRKDGSCYHVAVYNPHTGKFIKGVTHQGYSDQSMWSRGQAWAIYGYTMVYRYTKDQRFLDFARKITDIYLKRLKETSDDYIPFWDMDDPRIKTEKDKCPKDVSAACIVASALLELNQYAPSEGYREAAIHIISDLSSERYQSRNNNVSFLMHSTGHHPGGSEIDVSIIYADYYYMEALLRLFND